MDEWIEPVCVVCQWPLSTYSALILCSVDQSCPGNLFQAVQLRLCIPKGKGRSLLGVLSRHSPASGFSSHTQKTYSFCLFLSLFLFFSFSLSSSSLLLPHTHTYISSFSCSARCRAWLTNQLPPNLVSRTLHPSLPSDPRL